MLIVVVEGGRGRCRVERGWNAKVCMGFPLVRLYLLFLNADWYKKGVDILDNYLKTCTCLFIVEYSKTAYKNYTENENPRSDLSL